MLTRGRHQIFVTAGVLTAAVMWSGTSVGAVRTSAGFDPQAPDLGANPEAIAASSEDLSSSPGTIKAQPSGGVGSRAAALLLSGKIGGEIDGAVVWTSDGFAADGTQISIRVFIDVKGRDLLDKTTSLPIKIDIHAYLLNHSGALVGHISDVITLEDESLERRIENIGLKFVGDLRAPPGEYSLRILVLNRQTQRYFLHRSDLDIGLEERSAPILLPPLVPEAEDRWVIAIQHDLQATEVLNRNPAFTSWPSAMPTWRVEEPLEVYLGSSELGKEWHLSARLTARNGSPVLDPEVEVGPPISSIAGVSFYRVLIAAPVVPAGEYRLEITVADSEMEKAASQSLTVLIYDQVDTIVWTDPNSPRIQELPPPSPLPKRPSIVKEEATALTGTPSDAEPAPEPVRFIGGNIESPPPAEPIEAMALAGVESRGAALLLSGQSGGEVEGSVIWATGGFSEKGNTASIKVFVEVDGGGLLAGSRRLPVPITIHAYLIRSSGALVDHLSEGILLDNQPQALKIDEAGLKFVGELQASPGLYSLRVLVRNRQTNRFFLARRELDLRFDVGTTPVLLPPMVSEAEGSWVMSIANGLEPADVQHGIPGIESWPSAMPVWRADAGLEMVIGSSELGDNRHLSAQLFDGVGRLVGDPVLEVEESLTSRYGLSFYRVSAGAPDIPEGRYRFVVFATDSDSGESVSQSLTVLIHNQNTTFVWTDPGAPGVTEASSAPSALSQPAEPTPEERDERMMRAAYLESLYSWSRGRAVEARGMLAALEHPMGTSASTKNWRRLIMVERIAALEMGRNQPDSLMAIALLHRDMYDWYVARSEFQLARHSWQMASMIARIAPEFEGLDSSLDFSECLLLDLANRMVWSGERDAAQQLLEAASDIAPKSAPVLLGLGALYERSGNTGAAVTEFEALYSAHPEVHEGRLRLAVNRAHLGSTAAAEELLRNLLPETSPMWIRILAFQELGGLLIAEGRIGEAVALLDEGVARIPGNQRLQILLAYALDSAQYPREAATVIEEIGTRSSQQSTSPRYQYSAWPEFDAGRVRETLVASEAVGLPALLEALQ